MTDRCANCQVGQGRDCACYRPQEGDSARIWLAVLGTIAGWIVGALIVVAIAGCGGGGEEPCEQPSTPASVETIQPVSSCPEVRQ